MMCILSRVTQIVVILVFGSSCAMATLQCEQLRNETLPVPEYEREHLVDLCDATLDQHKGPIVSMEGGFLPFPDQFYVQIPERAHVELASGAVIRAGSIEEMENWPYGVVEIGDLSEFYYYKRSGSTNINVVESQGVKHARNRCSIPIEVIDFDRSHPSLSAIFDYQEIHLGDTAVLLIDGSVYLAIALVETFARLNCST